MDVIQKAIELAIDQEQIDTEDMTPRRIEEARRIYDRLIEVLKDADPMSSVVACTAAFTQVVPDPFDAERYSALETPAIIEACEDDD